MKLKKIELGFRPLFVSVKESDVKLVQVSNKVLLDDKGRALLAELADTIKEMKKEQSEAVKRMQLRVASACDRMDEASKAIEGEVKKPLSQRLREAPRFVE